MGLSELSSFRPIREILLPAHLSGSDSGHPVAALAMTNIDQFLVMLCGSMPLKSAGGKL